MIELGKRQELEVLREKEFGVYLGKRAPGGIGAAPQKAGSGGNENR